MNAIQRSWLIGLFCTAVFACLGQGWADDGGPSLEADLFVSGRDGYHTYRIPALLVTKHGTVLAFCEGRKASARDDGDIDLVLRRSTDGGRSWEPMRVVYEEGKAAPITIGNPCPVLDHETGMVCLPFCRNNDDVFVTTSADDGETWSTPRRITQDVKKPSW